MTKKISISMPDEDFERIEKGALESGMSVSEFIRTRSQDIYVEPDLRARLSDIADRMYMPLQWVIGRVLYGFAVIKDPVFDTNIIEPIDASLFLSAGNLLLSLVRPLNDSTELFILFLTFRTAPTINNPGTIFKAIVFEQSPGGNFYNITAEYKAIFGIELVVTEQLFMKFTTADKISGKLLTFQQKKIIL